MKNMKIRTKLLTSFLLLALITSIVGGIGIYSLRVTANETKLLGERTDMAIVSARIERNINQQRVAYLGVVAFDEIEEYDTAETYKEYLHTLMAEFNELESELDGHNMITETRQHFNDVKAVYPEFADKRDALMMIMDRVSESRLSLTGEAADADAENMSKLRSDVGNAMVAVKGASGPLIDNVKILTDFIETLTDEQTLHVEKTAMEVTIISVIILLAAIVIAVLLGSYIAAVISKPVNTMMGFLRQVGETGNLTFSEDALGAMRETVRYKDEISQSLAAFERMLDHLMQCGVALQSVAERDLTVHINTLGASDTIGNALTMMVNNLNNMFDEINTAAEQVSGGSQQIANGAQSLAQGASEQAASVQQLSAAIAGVSSSVREAAASARSAAEMSNSVRLKAERGSEQMGAMMEAVQAINDASQNIGKVIKVIDDIAFQTNILALNAAVEAARAGAAGRGFAVVAEEVRNLAAKSAEAAQDTETLIENSISKAVLGVKIAGETHESLIEIVDGVIESSRISNEIAASADREYITMNEINTGIDQVSQVVQQNSATAEEAAAASEELSGQSSMLSNLIGQFRLRAAEAYLPQAGAETISLEYNSPRIALEAAAYGEKY